ncbi:DUF2806 domain-containing protein [Scandinavium sp. H11S7]|uniref:DUF2806 domain-containing protein n=1 Tax=Scandinavium hiltneri TaxID=2926519 RepID=UPI0021664217|nr:DUF2806 domain-containing protein [Scandinavium hiltneri]MCS2155764.1 DUF2806 domain-containing protein [Scandinavium hiltneri]
MDKGIDVNINAELKADFQPVIASTPSAINKLFELLLGVKYARKKHFIKMIEAQGEKDKAAITNGTAIFDLEEMKLTALENRVEDNAISLIENEVKKDEVRNIISCARHAAIELENSTTPTDKEISKNFFNRWREEAKLVDDDYAQSIWGRILAEEIRQPETISLRTLDVLKNLSMAEANLFDKMGNYVVFGSSLVTGGHITEFEIRTLVDAGLVVFAGMYRTDKWKTTRLTYKGKNPQPGHYFDFNSTLFFSGDLPKDENLSLTFIPLTEQGRAIYRIASRNNSWDPSLMAMAAFEANKKLKKIVTYKYTNYLVSNNINMDDPVYFNRDDIITEETK